MLNVGRIFVQQQRIKAFLDSWSGFTVFGNTDVKPAVNPVGEAFPGLTTLRHPPAILGDVPLLCAQSCSKSSCFVRGSVSKQQLFLRMGS